MRRTRRQAGPKSDIYWGGRMKAKMARRRSGGGRRLVLLVGGLAAVGLLLWGGLEGYRVAAPLVAEWFEVQEVRVEGLSQLTRGEVLEQLALPEDATLLSVRTAELEKRLLAHPWVKEARISRVPPHTLEVSITERRAAAIVRTASLALAVDEDGHFLEVLPGEDGSSLPVLVGLDQRRLLDGDEPARRAVRVGVRVADVLARSFEGRPEVDVTNPDHPVAYFNGRRFRFGAESVEDQWDRYRQVEQARRVSAGVDEPLQGEEIDLQYPGKVILR